MLIRRRLAAPFNCNFTLLRTFIQVMGEAGVRKLFLVPGDAHKENDILFIGPSTSPAENVVYFGGDIQDYQERMEQHRDNKRHAAWSLEATAQLLHRRFPSAHVWLVKPSKMTLGTFAVFSNFVRSDPQGVPEFQEAEITCLPHLSALLTRAVAMLNAEVGAEVASTALPLRLVGFSKGCTVLGQLLYELPHYVAGDDWPLALQRLEEVFWLDGGHGGAKETWVTNRKVLKEGLEEFCRQHRKIKCHALSTPYQVKDPMRSWVGKDCKKFVEILKNGEVPVEANTFFENSPRSIEVHFKLLTTF